MYIYIFDLLFFYYFVRNSLLAVLEAATYHPSTT